MPPIDDRKVTSKSGSRHRWWQASRRFLLSLVMVVVGFAAALPAVEDGDPIEHRLLLVPAAEEEAPSVGPAAVNAFSQRVDALGAVHHQLGATQVKSLAHVGVQVVEFAPGTDMAPIIAAYKNDPRVASVEFDRWHVPYIEPTVPNDPQYGSLWGMPKIEAPRAWTLRNDASQVIVAVLDTGVNFEHPDLEDNMWVRIGTDDGDDERHGKNFVPEEDDADAGGDRSPMDYAGHGTHVAGTIGAVGDNGVGVVGVAWKVQLMALKVLGDRGGATSWIIEGVNHGVANNADIINASLGGPGEPGEAWLTMMDKVRDNGIIFVAAAGNDGTDNDEVPKSPANLSKTHNNVVTVAATDSGDNLASFSNYGLETVHLAAPGVNILSTWLGTGYQTLQGTSMAAPHVAGAFAILRAEFPNASHINLIDRLLKHVDKLDSLTGKVVTEGRLNLFRALTDGKLVGPDGISATPNPVILSPNPGAEGTTQISFDIFDTSADILWELTSGPDGATVTFIPDNTVAEPEVRFTQPGTYTLRVTVTAQNGDSVSRQVRVNVYWAEPQITSGPSATPDTHNANPGDSEFQSDLAVTASYDGDLADLIYTWSQVSGPENGVTFDPNGTNAANNSTATFTLAGTYELMVTITDEFGRTVDSNTVTVTVNASGAELAGAGEITITLRGSVPNNTVQLQALIGVGGSVENVPLSGNRFEHAIQVPLGTTDIVLRHRKNGSNNWNARRLRIDRSAVGPTAEN